MAAVSRLRYLRLAFLAKPVSDRRIYRQIKRRRIARIVEVGIASPNRSKRLVQVAQRFAPAGDVAYTAFDRFDARGPTESPLRLIDAHRAMAGTGAQIRLVPGEIRASIASTANSLIATDLLLVSAGVTDQDLEGGWFYFPRMLHAGSLILRESKGGDDQSSFLQASLVEIEDRAAAERRRRAA